MLLDLQKNRSQKLSMLEEKTKTVLESSLHSSQKNEEIFLNFRLIFQMRQKKVVLEKSCFQKYWKKLRCLFITLFGIPCRFQNCPCFFSSIDSFWLLLFWNLYKKRDPNIMKIVIFSKIKKWSQNSIFHILCKFYQDRSINKKKTQKSYFHT